MRIIYCGNLDAGSTSLSRFQALNNGNHHVIPIDIYPYILNHHRIIRGISTKLLLGPAIAKLNKEVLRKVELCNPDIVWIDKGVYLKPDTLRRIKRKSKAILVHHNTDDVLNKRHSFKYYLQSLDLYDYHFTSNIYNLKDLAKMTQSKVIFNEIGYDDNWYKSVIVNKYNLKTKSSDILFVGHWEENTQLFVNELINENISIKVHGPGWKNNKDYFQLSNFVSNGVWGEDYVRWLNCTKIGLGIVSKWNRNHTAGRIFEIPATGAMLLAERNDVLEKMYEEDHEAVFFNTKEEMVQKAKHYLLNEDERKRIANNGMLRCLKNKSTWRDRVKQAMADMHLD
jgi:spore maturation protein CgeB